MVTMLIKQTNCHLLFISFTLLLLPLACFSRSHLRRVLLSHEADSYAVIFDAGSRVHVFRFNQNLDLLPIGDDIEFLVKVRDMLRNESSFKYKAEWVSILTGTQEGSYFWVGIIEPKKSSEKVKPIAYLKAAKSTFPNAKKENIPYLCMDVVYEYTLLVDGFGLNPYKEITVLNGVQYKKYLVEAAWPLGCAIDVISSSADKLLS
nr:apyrase-like [Ipomoea batatas]